MSSVRGKSVGLNGGVNGGVSPEGWLLCSSCGLFVGRKSEVDFRAYGAGVCSLGGRAGWTEEPSRESLLWSEWLLLKEKMEEMRLAIVAADAAEKDGRDTAYSSIHFDGSKSCDELPVDQHGAFTKDCRTAWNNR